MFKPIWVAKSNTFKHCKHVPLVHILLDIVNTAALFWKANSQPYWFGAGHGAKHWACMAPARLARNRMTITIWNQHETGNLLLYRKCWLQFWLCPVRVSSQWNKITTVGAAITPVRAKATNMIRMHVSTKNARGQHISTDSDRPSIFYHAILRTIPSFDSIVFQFQSLHTLNRTNSIYPHLLSTRAPNTKDYIRSTFQSGQFDSKTNYIDMKVPFQGFTPQFSKILNPGVFVLIWY